MLDGSFYLHKYAYCQSQCFALFWVGAIISCGCLKYFFSNPNDNLKLVTQTFSQLICYISKTHGKAIKIKAFVSD